MKKFSFKGSLGLSAIIALAALIYGLYFFSTNWSYSEEGHEYLFGGYALLSILLFFTIRFSQKVMSALLIFCLALVTLYSAEKFNWRKSYIQAANSGKYFPLDPYIESYPTFEQYKFNWLTGTPKWVDFVEDCYNPMLNKTSIDRDCKTSNLIQDNYGIDVKNIIRDHYKKMQSTAMRLEKGRLKNKRQFEKCLEEKECAKIPLLPPEAEGIEQQSTLYLDIRKQFWSVVNDNRISEKNCNFFEFCRLMLKNDIVSIDNL